MFREVFCYKARGAHNDTRHPSVCTWIIACEVRLQLINYHIEEFRLAWSILVESTVVFGNWFFNLGFKNCFLLRHQENMADSFLHRDRNQMSLLLFLDHLVKFLDMDRIVFLFKNRDLSWWLNIHWLLDSHANPLVLSSIDSVDSKSVCLRVISHVHDL